MSVVFWVFQVPPHPHHHHHAASHPFMALNCSICWCWGCCCCCLLAVANGEIAQYFLMNRIGGCFAAISHPFHCFGRRVPFLCARLCYALGLLQYFAVIADSSKFDFSLCFGMESSRNYYRRHPTAFIVNTKFLKNGLYHYLWLEVQTYNQLYHCLCSDGRSVRKCQPGRPSLWVLSRCSYLYCAVS